MTSRIGKYSLEALLGMGSMGSVYRGLDTPLGAPVAVKVIHEHLAQDPGTLQRFEAEALIQARLRHPNVVCVQDFVQENGRAAIVMEYMDGRSLDEVLAAQTGPMPYERCLAVMRQVLEAVGYAHQQGIVHRDLKPSNILAQWYGSRVHVKVSDFGIAKILGDERRRTGTHAKMGTLAYMSPEQIQSPREVDHRADIYSLGCTLYEMATGVAAHEEETEYEVMTAIVDGRVVPPREKYPHIGEEFEGVILKAMSAEPLARYQSCEEFLAALEGALEEKGRVSRPPAKGPSQPAVVERPVSAPMGPPHQDAGGMVLLPAGSFVMGSPPDEPGRDSDETQHLVVLTRPFLMSDHQVTQAEWLEFTQWNNSGFRGANLPAEGLTWYDAIVFCNQRSAAEGLDPAYSVTHVKRSGRHIVKATVKWDAGTSGYRLPTEAEWEYACRAGTETAFCNGGTAEIDNGPVEPILNAVGWYNGNAGRTTHPVKGKLPNAWGLYDMHGNVWEWCWDRYGSYEGNCADPRGRGKEHHRVLRGGSYDYSAWYCRSALRFYFTPGNPHHNSGFRIARTAF